MTVPRFIAALAASLVLLPQMALAAEVPHIDGAAMGLAWVIPFAGILLSIAIIPLIAPSFWHHHYGKVSAFWAACFLLPYALSAGPAAAGYEVVHVALAEYLPFIILLLSLFTVAGGIAVKGDLVGTPLANTGLLAVGTVIASWTGTTGAAMLLVRPVIRANLHRKRNAHVLVFFIFLVANVGGALTPLGDPPLFLGFLKGVSFFWPTVHLLPEMIFVSVVLLALFFALDSWYAKRDGLEGAPAKTGVKLHLEGLINLPLLGCVVGAVLLSGIWKPGVEFNIFGVHVELQNIVRDLLLLGIAALSLKLTPKSVREANAFTWGPIEEVAKLFAGIFLTIIPAIAILRAGTDGALGAVVAMVTTPDGQPIVPAYFWLTGILSSFLDNAPTYLVFFNTAGGDPLALMTTHALTLAAISAGAVFMGANTYIGNAPNFMVRAIAEERGIKMPSFFGYMAWSGAILIPVFLLTTVIFFR